MTEKLRESAEGYRKWGYPETDTVKHVLAMNQRGEHGAPLTEDAVRSLVNEVYAAGRPRLSVISSADLQAIHYEPPKLLVENILPERSMVIASAAPKNGKSTFAISLCHALATGTPFLGKLAVQKSRVLYWIPDDENVQRFKRGWWNCAGDEEVPGFHLSITQARLPDAFGLLEDAIQKYEVQVCVVDAYTKIRGKLSGDFVQQEYDDMRRFAEIARSTNCAVVLIHHHSKGGSRAASKNDEHLASAGSFAISGGADTLWSFERVGGHRKLMSRGRDLDDYEMVYMRDEDHKLRFLADGAAAEHWQDLLGALDNGLPDRFGTKELADCTDKNVRTARRWSQKWAYAGLIRMVGGMYALSPEYAFMRGPGAGVSLLSAEDAEKPTAAPY